MESECLGRVIMSIAVGRLLCVALFWQWHLLFKYIFFKHGQPTFKLLAMF